MCHVTFHYKKDFIKSVLIWNICDSIGEQFVLFDEFIYRMKNEKELNKTLNMSSMA